MMIRTQVFVIEQQVPAEIELDHWDAVAWHLLAYQKNQPIGTLRLFVDTQGQGCLGRMAVRAACRGQGFGHLLLTEALIQAQRLAFTSLLIHAQCQAAGFYRKVGFLPFGEIFMEAGISHQLMRLSLVGGSPG